MPINWDAPIEIRDNRNGNWFWVDKEVWADKKLSSSDKVVYGTLAYFANNKNQSAFPSYSVISKYSDVSERQCYYSVNKLKKLNYIHIKRGGGRGKPNIYTLLENPAKIAEIKKTLQNNTENPAINAVETLQNNTTNNNYINNNKLTRISVYTKLTDITEKDLEEIASSYKVSLGFVKLQLEKLINYCQAQGKTYRNYKSALRNFVLSDMQRDIERPRKGKVIDATNL